MQDPVDADTRDLRVWLVRVSHGGAKELRNRVIEAGSMAKVEVLVMRADMVFGSDHIRSALYHAKRAIREGRNASESLAMETLLYASGERQLSTAIRKMSVEDGADEVVVAQLTPGPIEEGRSWKPMERMNEGSRAESLARFGVSKEELATVGSAKALDLVLERVASVDVLKK